MILCPNKKIGAYKIVTGWSAAEVDIAVNQLIVDGWVPLGAPFIAPQPSSLPHQFYQALIKEV